MSAFDQRGQTVHGDQINVGDQRAFRRDGRMDGPRVHVVRLRAELDEAVAMWSAAIIDSIETGRSSEAKLEDLAQRAEARWQGLSGYLARLRLTQPRRGGG